MTHKRKRPDLRGQPFLSGDIERLARLFKKYGKASFDEACQSVQSLEGRGPGRDSHTEQNLFTVYLALHESVTEIGIEKTCKALSGHVESVTGEKYTPGGLKTLYRRARDLIESNPDLKRRATMFEDLRTGRTAPLTTIGDKIPAFPKGPIVPVLAKRR
jgi:hypothetical protein